MNQQHWKPALIVAAMMIVPGCTVPNVDFSTINRPDRAPELDAYNVFVGSWTWEAEMLNAVERDRSWSGTAEWSWILDKRCLRGEISSRSEHTEFTAAGIWSWNPKSKQYIWTMFNNWGYPQNGRAKFDAVTASWDMDYRSIGLDGTTSYGRHRIRVVDDDTLAWDLSEWADALHTIKKMEMRGTYKRVH